MLCEVVVALVGSVKKFACREVRERGNDVTGTLFSQAQGSLVCPRPFTRSSPHFSLEFIQITAIHRAITTSTSAALTNDLCLQASDAVMARLIIKKKVKED